MWLSRSLSVSTRVKPITAVKIIQKVVTVGLNEMDARIITLHANISKGVEEDFNLVLAMNKYPLKYYKWKASAKRFGCGY